MRLPEGAARQAILAVALVPAVGGAVWLRVHIASDQAHALYPPPERVQVVARGATADLQGYRWRLEYARQDPPYIPSPGMTRVTFAVLIQPLSVAAATKAAKNDALGLTYEYRDPAGHRWGAGRPRGTDLFADPEPLAVGRFARRLLVQEIPTVAAATVRLYITRPVWSSAETQALARQGRAPRHRPVLAFAR